MPIQSFLERWGGGGGGGGKKGSSIPLHEGCSSADNETKGVLTGRRGCDHMNLPHPPMALPCNGQTRHSTIKDSLDNISVNRR